MSAEVLRRAAALMRERAEAARAGRWMTAPSTLTPQATLVVAEWENDQRRVATCAGSLPEGNEANATHIASWHPSVALAVADWLDNAASDATYERHRGDRTPTSDALAVARAYLGEQP